MGQGKRENKAMGQITRGILEQRFEIRLDIESLREYIADQVIKAIGDEKDKSGHSVYGDLEIDESYLEDDDKLVIKGSYTTAFENWYCRATLYEPEENETERAYIGKDNWILSELPEEIKSRIEVYEVKEDDEDSEEL